MVSRRKILSRSRDDLNIDNTFIPDEEEEDVWYQKDKLYKEHIQEVLDKWTQIDDEIWAKVIVFEHNRRVAKAYARAPVLTINGSEDGFDGMRIGLCGFDNPMRDAKTEDLKKLIGQGVKIKMDDAGNILIRRYAKSNVFVKSTVSNTNEETSIGSEILKLPNQALEIDKIVKLFDMKKFQSNVNRELRRAYPDRRRLETQCLSIVSFVKSENELLECPIWVLIINVVAMDMLKSKLPPVQRTIIDIKNRPRIPIPDEDPYSVAGNGSGASSGSSGFGGPVALNNSHQQSISSTNNIGISNMYLKDGINHINMTRDQLLQTHQMAHKRSEKPPKLPPRDNIYAHDIIPKPDYDDIDVQTRIKLSRGKSDKGKDNKKYDDPYYCGLRARVPNFVKSSKLSRDQKDVGSSNTKMSINTLTQKKNSMINMPHHSATHSTQANIKQRTQQMGTNIFHNPITAHQHMWQTRSFESGIGIYKEMDQSKLKQKYFGHRQGQTKTNVSQSKKATQRRHYYNNEQLRSCTKHFPTAEHSYELKKNNKFLKEYRNDLNTSLKNCNCMSCYTLAPLFGAIPPTRPSRSLSQQLLRQHQILSGGLADIQKFCSESDLSELERCFYNRKDFSNKHIDKYEKRQIQNEDSIQYEFKNDFFCLHSDNQFKHVTPKNYELENKLILTNCIHQEQDLGICDDDNIQMATVYGKNSKIHQTQSPLSNKLNDLEKRNFYKNANSNLLFMHNKSISIESFFERPTEKGSLYCYNSRKNVQKTPSTNNIYDQVRNSIDSDAFRTNTKDIEIKSFYRKTPNKNTDRQSIKGFNVCPLYWKTRRNGSKNAKEKCKFKNDLSSKALAQASTKQQSINTTNCDIKNQSNNIDTNDILLKTETFESENKLLSQSPINLLLPNKDCYKNSVDISDMESIYGYLKPRKPRNLNLKKIQFINY